IPWNAPIAGSVWKIAPAIATGCTVVLKPSEEASLTVLLIARLLAEAGLPDGVLNVVTGHGADAGAALAAHPGVDKIVFTGSTATGQAIARAATGTLKHVSLELGEIGRASCRERRQDWAWADSRQNRHACT